jgi:hypothetical protein
MFAPLQVQKRWTPPFYAPWVGVVVLLAVLAFAGTLFVQLFLQRPPQQAVNDAVRAAIVIAMVTIVLVQIFVPVDHCMGRVIRVNSDSNTVHVELECFEDVGGLLGHKVPSLRIECLEQSSRSSKRMVRFRRVSAGPSQWAVGLRGTYRVVTIFPPVTTDNLPSVGDVVSYRNKTLRSFVVMRRVVPETDALWD